MEWIYSYNLILYLNIQPLDIDGIRSQYWYGLCDIYVAEGVLVLIRLWSYVILSPTPLPTFTGEHRDLISHRSNGDYCQDNRAVM